MSPITKKLKAMAKSYSNHPPLCPYVVTNGLALVQLRCLFDLSMISQQLRVFLFLTIYLTLVNDQSTTARVLVFNNLFDISQIKSELSNLNKNTFERILIILNVRKDSFSGDTFQSDYGRKGNHYSLLEIDFMMKTVTYFDSKGWTVPKGL